MPNEKQIIVTLKYQGIEYFEIFDNEEDARKFLEDIESVEISRIGLVEN